MCLSIKETLGQAWSHSSVLLAFRAEARRTQVQKQPEHNEKLPLKVENIKNNNVNFIDVFSISMYSCKFVCLCFL